MIALRENQGSVLSSTQAVGAGTGRGIGRGTGGRGRMGGRGLGVGGDCVCANYGHRITHQRGTPCYEVNCPKCGTPMSN